MTDSNTAAWRLFLERQIKRSERRMLKLILETVAEAMVDERNKQRAEFTAELGREMAALHERLEAVERGTKPAPRLVPDKGSMIA
jgi:L-fucose isomerase-like protein